MKKDQSPHDTQAEEAEMEVLIGYVLLGGVVLSAVLVCMGLIWHWVRTGHLGVNYVIPRTNLFEFVVADVRQLGSAESRPRVLISLGIAMLLLTPYVRVLASMLFFLFVEHNWKYSLFTAFVLAVLTYSLFLR